MKESFQNIANQHTVSKDVRPEYRKLYNKCDLFRSAITEYGSSGLLRKIRKVIMKYPATFNYSIKWWKTIY